MKVIEDIRKTQFDFPHLVLTVGSFDGVHLGHRRVLDEVVRVAREHNGTAAVLTMRPHPREFFSPAHAPNLLTCDKAKARLLKAAGIDTVLTLEFTADVANLDPHEFVGQIIHRCCHAKTVIVGHDFRFGRNALGNYQFLEQVGPAHGFDVRQVPPLILGGERVSSTLIRERVLQGDLERVETFLGRKYSVVGEVIPGHGVGAELGFPTANIEPRHNAVPAQGVYVAEAVVDDRRYPAAVNIGIAPTIRQTDIIVEAHLLDFHDDILGEEIEILFHKRLRTEKKFRSREQLANQIRRDVREVRGYFGE